MLLVDIGCPTRHATTVLEVKAVVVLRVGPGFSERWASEGLLFTHHGGDRYVFLLAACS